MERNGDAGQSSVIVSLNGLHFAPLPQSESRLARFAWLVFVCAYASALTLYVLAPHLLPGPVLRVPAIMYFAVVVTMFGCGFSLGREK